MEFKTNYEAEIIKAHRTELGLTQLDVAVEAEITLQHYQKYEYGIRLLSKSSMVLGLKICRTLKIDPFELCFPENEK